MTRADGLTDAERAERLRQSRLAFNQRQNHRERWFKLRTAMGWVAVGTLPIVCAAAAFVIFDYREFGAKAVTVASAALLTAVGLLAAAWRQILAGAPVKEEEPVKGDDLGSGADTDG